MKRIDFEQKNTGITTLYYLNIRFKKHLLKIDVGEFLKFLYKLILYISLLVHIFLYCMALATIDYLGFDLKLIPCFIITIYICYTLFIKE